VLLQAAAYLGGEREPLAGMLWLSGPEREDLKARLHHTAVLGQVGLRLPEVLGPFWER
jgi:hypothetical protein